MEADRKSADKLNFFSENWSQRRTITKRGRAQRQAISDLSSWLNPLRLWYLSQSITLKWWEVHIEKRTKNPKKTKRTWRDLEVRVRRKSDVFGPSKRWTITNNHYSCQSRGMGGKKNNNYETFSNSGFPCAAFRSILVGWMIRRSPPACRALVNCCWLTNSRVKRWGCGCYRALGECHCPLSSFANVLWVTTAWK